MRVLAVHPGPLMYTKIFLRLEPLGLELVAAAVRRAGHEARLIDLQAGTHKDYFRLVDDWQPDVVAFSCNYLANVPEVVDLAKLTRARRPDTFIFVGGHSASFTAQELLEHAGGAIDCILKGEGEASVAELLEAVEHDRRSISRVSGVVTLDREGPPARLVEDLDALVPARDLLRRRRRYFLGTLDPCASIEFARGCPWDCSFCSAWTFYGRSYRVVSPERAVEDLASIREPGVFIVDDVAFVQASTASRSAKPSRAGGFASSTISRRAATCCSATRTCSGCGRGWACSTCSSGSRPSTRRACASTESASRSATPSRRSSSRARSASRSPST